MASSPPPKKQKIAAKREGEQSGGYDCHFIDAPHEDDYCLICQLPAREPQQTKCDCAKLLCRSCYEKQKGLAGTCPTCRKPLDAFPDRNISRRLKVLKVKCTSEGCPWKNELGLLEGHLGNCEYVMTDCTNDCKSTYRRCDLQRHLVEECPFRWHFCEHCNEEGAYAGMVGDHLNVCPNIMVLCSNDGCKAQVVRREMKDHTATCPHATINCPYMEIGCSYVSLREAMEEHSKNATPLHLNLALVEVGKLRDRVCCKFFNMLNFKQHMVTGDEWYTPGFYTYPNGYKMCLNVHTCSGTDAHLSVYLRMMKGENDDNLLWPFHYRCTISLLNQLRDGGHRTKYLWSEHDKDNTEDSDDQSPHNTRVVEGQFHNMCFGFENFISLNELHLQKGIDIQYLMDDCIYFKVEVKVLDGCKPWLTSAEACK